MKVELEKRSKRGVYREMARAAIVDQSECGRSSQAVTKAVRMR
jgi:hypothetical protein